MPSSSRSEMARAAELVRFCNEVSALPGCSVALPVPKCVFMGHQSSGKSSVVECILGTPLNVVGDGTATRCPLEFFVVNDVSQKHPVWAVTLPGSAAEPITGLSTTAVAEVLRKHNAARHGFDPNPVRLEMRWCDTGNYVFVDLPGLQNNPQLPRAAEEIHDINVEAVRRLLTDDDTSTINIVVVEETVAQHSGTAFDPSKLLSLPHVTRVLQSPVLAAIFENPVQRARVRVVLAQSKCDLLLQSGEEFMEGLGIHLRQQLAAGVAGFAVDSVFMTAGLSRKKRDRVLLEGVESGAFGREVDNVEAETSVLFPGRGSDTEGAEGQSSSSSPSHFHGLSFGVGAMKQWLAKQVLSARPEELVRAVRAEIDRKTQELAALQDTSLHLWAMRDLWPFCNSVHEAFAAIWTVREGSPQGSAEERACARLLVDRVTTLDEEYETIRQACSPFSYRDSLDELEDQLPEVVHGCNTRLWGSGQVRRAIHEFILSVSLAAGREQVVDRAHLASFIASAKASLPIHSGADEFRNWNSIACQAMALFKSSSEVDQDICAVNDAILSICTSWIDDALSIATSVAGQPRAPWVLDRLREAIRAAIDTLCTKMKDECRRVFSQTALFSGVLPEAPAASDTLETRLARAKLLTSEDSATIIKPSEMPANATLDEMIPLVEQACTRRYLTNLQLSCALVQVVHRQTFQDCLVREVKHECGKVAADLMAELADSAARDTRASDVRTQIQHLNASLAAFASFAE